MKKLWEKLEKNQYYVTIFKNPFTYVTGAVLLSVLQVALLAASGNPWGVSGTFANWGAWIFDALGGSVDKWFYFSSAGAQNTLKAGVLGDPGSIQNVGIIIGALTAALLASQFKFKKIKSVRQVVAAILGGLLMGYGARLAYGCNIGALFSGIASLSLSGWVFACALLVGAFIGSKLLARFFM
ncbi:MAG TPA: YeeE/YedE thiosulfate transporter family protein [Bacillota bacterium]|nr:YeeE/YedE thiosulfate transporter family protein [Bacillota bacterium]